MRLGKSSELLGYSLDTNKIGFYRSLSVFFLFFSFHKKDHICMHNVPVNSGEVHVQEDFPEVKVEFQVIHY